VSLEKFKIPRDVLVVCLGKSTYARCGIIINVTTLEPEWEGHVTIEVSNTAPLPCRVYAEEGIMQLLFFRSDVHREHSDSAMREMMQGLEGIVSSQDHWADKDHGCRTSYADKKGRYQSQKAEVTLPFVRQEVKNELEADVAYNLVRGGLPPRQPKVTKEPKAHKFNHKKKKSK
jgi:deoxycytidine triphosphate deaminase